MPSTSTKKKPIAKKGSAKKQSKHPGVTWSNARKKWQGQVNDRSVRVGETVKTCTLGSFTTSRRAPTRWRGSVRRSRRRLRRRCTPWRRRCRTRATCRRARPRRPTPSCRRPTMARSGAAPVALRPRNSAQRATCSLKTAAQRRGFSFSRAASTMTNRRGSRARSRPDKDGKHCIGHGGGPRLGEAASDRCYLCKSITDLCPNGSCATTATASAPGARRA